MKYFKFPLLTCILLFVLENLCLAQGLYKETIAPVENSMVSMSTYDKHTSAVAVVLTEVGNARIDVSRGEDRIELQYDYYVRIKILKQAGISFGDVEVPLNRNLKGVEETITNVEASSYNLNSDGSVTEQKLDSRKVFLVNEHELITLARFAVPGIRVGSIIDYHYTVNSPFFNGFQFHSWDFQSEIPKISSRFTAHIPANFKYRISLRGFQKLSENKQELEKDCFVLGSGTADCSKLTYVMVDIPAFHTEKYMLDESNYVSKIEFEMASFKSFVGGKYNFTETWKDEDLYLKQTTDFGWALKKGAEFFKIELDSVSKSNETDSVKARKIFSVIRERMKWNNIYSVFATSSIKKLYELRTGTSGDINLMLIAALRSAGISADPVMVSVRSRSAPRKIFPVIGDFHYIIASVILGEQTWLLDATNKHLAFGMISDQCLTHEGRLFPSQDSSRWVPIKVPAIAKSVSFFNLDMDAKGNMKGNAIFYNYGYKALEERTYRNKFASEDDFLDAKTKLWPSSHIDSFTEKGLNEPEEAYENEFNIEFVNHHIVSVNRLEVFPFISQNFSKNPFSLSERLFPVDFGFPTEENVLIKIRLPKGFHIESKPMDLSFTLPSGSGYFMMIQDSTGELYTLTYKVRFNKSVYNVNEYAPLKEFVSQIIKLEKSSLILVRN